ncbi:hypothetical protein [Adonisia turfae]|uniref:Uncharacterized protein n=1 Tax=Adonisia turfae CCMR0081 TaxID=2292702 RepID=A0A6M0RP77_9CYAN|nr:hypothetical protein [Adonisia turfae]NEZ57563.1 hypothetical protein [Adonisia turfae CCMR0081]
MTFMKPGAICTISLSASYERALKDGGGFFKDNEYTFYTDGEVLHQWDESDWRYGLTEWLTVKDLSGKKALFLSKCPEKYKTKLQKLFEEFSSDEDD